MYYDYGIIGGGPAGYTAAMLLAKKGKSVVLFEKNQIGGTCLNRGCIPTKALLHMSEVYKQTIESSNIGLDIEVKNFDFSKIASKRDLIVEKIRKSLELAVKNSGVNIIYATAEIVDDTTILADNVNYKIGKIIFAAGSKPRELEGLECDHEFILNSDDVLKITKLPKSVLIVGSGAIGIEWARIFSNFGVSVSLIEYAEHLLPSADIEVSKRIERIFKQQKVEFYLNTTIKNIDNKTVKLSNGMVKNPEVILSAAGRVPLSSNVNNITTIGDSCGEIQLAHFAIHQAQNLVEGIDFNKQLTPAVIYGEPEIAWVGLREQDCKDDCEKITLPITALGKSWCDNCTEGFIKLITKNNCILGAHIISKEASALIHEILIAMENKVSVNDLKKVCFAHPTYSEGIFEAICRL